MNKKTFEALGKVFDAEVNGKQVFQSKAKIYKELEVNGYVNHVEFVDGIAPPVRVRGWVLTPGGHCAYCQACNDYFPEPL